MKNEIAVYCGSSEGNSKKFKKGAKKLALALKENNFSLVYGGGSTGLMGIIAEEMIKLKANVVGVITKDLANKEKAFKKANKIIYTKTMHKRKEIMAKRAKGFIAMPGGAGTMDEFFEVFTWAQLGYHKKPIALYNIDGFYDFLYEFLEKVCYNGFISKEHLDMIFISKDENEIINHLKNYKAPKSKWE